MTLTYADGSPLLVADAAWLKILRVKLERAENAVGRTLPTTEQCRTWHKAYTTYHLARVKLEQCECVPCAECNGRGIVTTGHNEESDDAVFWDTHCPDCTDTPGKWACEQCGENGATELSGKDLVCRACADDLTKRTEACLSRLED